MSIRRGYLSFSAQFVQIPNTWARDERLSRRARGLLAELMSHQLGWIVTIETLIDAGPEGRDALRSAIAELEEAGYLIRERDRDAETGQLAGTNYTITDPQAALFPTPEKPKVGKATVGKSPTKKTKSLEDKLFEEDHVVANATNAPKRPVSIPASFALDDLMVAWAHKNTPLVTDLQRELGKFSDWSRAHGKKFTDWPAAWRNWMRKANDYEATRRGADNVRPSPVTDDRQDQLIADMYRQAGIDE